MRTKIIALLLIVSVLLAGCTPAASSGDTAQVASQPVTTAETQGTTTTSATASTSISETSSAESETSTSIVTSGASSASVFSWPEPPAPTPVLPDDDGQAGDPPAEQPGPPVSEEPAQELSWEVTHAYYFPLEPPYEMLNPYEDSYTPTPNNAGTPEDYITGEYNAADLLFSFDGWQSVHVADRGETPPLGIGTVNHAYPIECLRQLDENTYYAVYKAQQGGYVYVHFQKMLEEPSWYEQYYHGIYAMTSITYVREPHAYADFSGIKIGDPVTKLETVDTSASAWIKRHTKLRAIHFRQVLTDGAIFIIAAADENGEYKISDIRYFPDGIEDFSKWHERGLEINHNILPQDFPQ